MQKQGVFRVKLGSVSKSAAVGLGEPPAMFDPEEIRRQLRAVLTSPAFLGSKRSQQFLEYVCEKSLRGEASTLKERTIAVEVFGRAPESDLGEDTIVRVSAREVRKRLAQYYTSPAGATAEIRIELPSGSYAPEFRPSAAPTVEPEPLPAPLPPTPFAWRRMWPAAAIVLAMAVAGVLWVGGGSVNTRAFRTFWEPVLSAPDPLLMAVAHPIVYHASGRAHKLTAESQPPTEQPVQRAIQVPPEKLNGNDIVPVFNQYVGVGDMVVATEITSMLAGRSKTVRLRLASGVEFADLRKQPVLLIGAITNRWTVEMQQSWRFRFRYTPGAKTVIADTVEAREWSITSKDDGSAQEDFLLVSRVRSSQTGGVILVAAGLKQFGTEAAGHLLADPDQLGPILRQLPKGWEAKSVQLVLHARVIGNTPTQPEIVATHVW
jgi:hypothetical protein